MKNTSYTLYIGGTKRAQESWGHGRTYTSRASARRRMRQIRASGDFGVVSIWLLPKPGPAEGLWIEAAAYR